MMDINERQDQSFTSTSNRYVCGNNGRDICLRFTFMVEWRQSPYLNYDIAILFRFSVTDFAILY